MSSQDHALAAFCVLSCVFGVAFVVPLFVSAVQDPFFVYPLVQQLRVLFLLVAVVITVGGPLFAWFERSEPAFWGTLAFYVVFGVYFLVLTAHPAIPLISAVPYLFLVLSSIAVGLSGRSAFRSDSGDPVAVGRGLRAVREGLSDADAALKVFCVVHIAIGIIILPLLLTLTSAAGSTGIRPAEAGVLSLLTVSLFGFTYGVYETWHSGSRRMLWFVIAVDLLVVGLGFVMAWTAVRDGALESGAINSSVVVIVGFSFLVLIGLRGRHALERERIVNSDYTNHRTQTDRK